MDLAIRTCLNPYVACTIMFLISMTSYDQSLGHAGFYRRFIKDFSRISRPLMNLLAKDAPFNFDEECLVAFYTLKKALMSAPIIQPPDWKLPIEIMCDASLVNVEITNIMLYPTQIRH